jgi:hypothetical protein
MVLEKKLKMQMFNRQTDDGQRAIRKTVSLGELKKKKSLTVRKKNEPLKCAEKSALNCNFCIKGSDFIL